MPADLSKLLGNTRNKRAIIKPVLINTELGSIRNDIALKDTTVKPDSTVMATNFQAVNNAQRIAEAFGVVGRGMRDMAKGEVDKARMDYAERKQAEAEAKQAAREAEAEAKQRRYEDGLFWASTSGVDLQTKALENLRNIVESSEFAPEQVEDVHEEFSSKVIGWLDGADRETRLASRELLQNTLKAGYGLIQRRVDKMRADNTSQDFNDLYSSDNLDSEQTKTYTQTLIQNNIDSGGSRSEAIGIAKNTLLQQIDSRAEKGDIDSINYLKQVGIDSGIVTPGTADFYKWSEDIDKFIKDAENTEKIDDSEYAEKANLESYNKYADMNTAKEVKDEIRRISSTSPDQLNSKERIAQQKDIENGVNRLKVIGFNNSEHNNILNIRQEQAQKILAESIKVDGNGNLTDLSPGVMQNEKGEYGQVSGTIQTRIFENTRRRYLDTIGDIKPLSDEAEDLYWRLLNEEYQQEGATEIKQLNPRYATKWDPREWTVDYVSNPNNHESIIKRIENTIKNNPRKTLYEHVSNAIPADNPEHVAVRSYIATEIYSKQQAAKIKEIQKKLTTRNKEFTDIYDQWRDDQLILGNMDNPEVYGGVGGLFLNDIDLRVRRENTDYEILDIAAELYLKETGKDLELETSERSAEIIDYYLSSGQIVGVQRENYSQLYRELTDEFEPYSAKSIKQQQEDIKLEKKVEKALPKLEAPPKPKTGATMHAPDLTYGM